MSIWMAVCPFAMAQTSSHNMRLINCRRKRRSGAGNHGSLRDEPPDQVRRRTLLNMEALPPNHRDLSLSARIAGWRASPASACSRNPGPEPALELLPSSALSSAQVFTAYPKTARLAKSEFTKTVNHVPGMKCKRCSGIDSTHADTWLVRNPR
jgi:hypothetical protein